MRASLTGGIDILPCGRRHVRIPRYARIEVGRFHRGTGISALLRHVLDARIYLGRSNGWNTGLLLLGDRVRSWRATVFRRGRRESIGPEMASAGRKLRMAMATNPEALPDTLLLEDKREPLPHSCFDHDIFISSSVMTFEGSTY